MLGNIPYMEHMWYETSPIAWSHSCGNTSAIVSTGAAGAEPLPATEHPAATAPAMEDVTRVQPSQGKGGSRGKPTTVFKDAGCESPKYCDFQWFSWGTWGVENLEGLNWQPRNDFKRMEVLVWKQSSIAPNIGVSGCNSPSNNKRSHWISLPPDRECD